MVTPRLTALGALDRGLLRQGRRASGLIQRGRVLSVDTDYNPPLLSVSVHLLGGQSATIRNVLTLSAVYQPRAIVGPDLTAAQADAMVTPQVGNEVLLLCPTGRAADEAYSMGLATVAAALADHADAPVNGYVKAPVTFRYSIPPEGSDRLLTVTGTSAVLGAGTARDAYCEDRRRDLQSAVRVPAARIVWHAACQLRGPVLANDRSGPRGGAGS